MFNLFVILSRVIIILVKFKFIAINNIIGNIYKFYYVRIITMQNIKYNYILIL